MGTVSAPPIATVSALQNSGDSVSRPPTATVSTGNAAIIQQALVNIDMDNIVSSGGVVTSVPNSGLGLNYLDLPGGAGDNASTPDSLLLDISGDIDVRVEAALDDWTPAGSNRSLLGKYNSTGNQRGYLFQVLATSGLLRWIASADGIANTVDVVSTVAPTVSDGETLWVRVAFDVDNGASGNTVTFYTSPDGITWTQLGDPVITAGATSIFDSSADLEIGTHGGGTSSVEGRIFRAQILDGIDGPIAADFNPENHVSGTTLRSGPKVGQLPGNAGDFISTVDSSANSITSDIAIFLDLKLVDYTPASAQVLCSKWDSAGNERSYQIDLNTDGTIGLLLSSAGTAGTSVSASSTVAPGFTDGERAKLLVVWDNGANTLNVYEGFSGNTAEAVSWSQVGTADVTLSLSGIHDGTAPLAVGANSGTGSAAIDGLVYSGAFYSGGSVSSGVFSGGVLEANYNSEDYESGTDLTSSTTGEVWSENGNAVFQAIYAINGSAAIGGYDLNTIVGTGANLKPHPTGTALFYGANGDFISTPDSAAISVTGDIDIRVEAALDDWTPGAVPGDRELLLSKWDSAGNNSYALNVEGGSGNLRLIVSTDGSATTVYTSTAPPTVANGERLWVRAALDVDNGSAGSDCTFFTSSDGGSWTPLGSVVTGAVVSIFDGSADLEIGAFVSGTSGNLLGNVKRAQVRDGIDGALVADFNPLDAGNQGATTFQSGPKMGQTPGQSGDNFETPAGSSFLPSDEIEVICRCALADWTTGGFQAIAAQRVGASGNQTFIFYADPTAGGTLLLSLNGFGTQSTAPHGFGDGALRWIRANWNLSEDVIRYYTSDDDTDDVSAVTWTQLGADVAVTGATLNAGLSPIEIGARENGTLDLCALSMRRMVLRDTIDGANLVDFYPARDYVSGSTMPSSTTGEVWTANGNAVFQATWTLNGNTFIQNTGHQVAHSIGSVGIETAIGQTINSPGTVFAVARFTNPTPTADQTIIDARADGSARWFVESHDGDSDRFSYFQGTVEIGLDEAYDLNPHVWTIQFNGDASSQLTVSGVGSKSGDAGTNNWDYCSMFVAVNGLLSMQGYIRQLLVFDFALTDSEIEFVQYTLESENNL